MTLVNTNTNVNHSINVFLIIFFLYKFFFQSQYTYTYENMYSYQVKRLPLKFTYNIEKDSDELMYIYKLPQGANIKSFKEIKGTYGLDWMEISYSYCDLHKQMKCTHLVKYRGVTNGPIWANDIKNIDDCYNLIYNPEYYSNTTKYIKLNTLHNNLHNIHLVMSYLTNLDI
jgi:hypothetical protein